MLMIFRSSPAHVVAVAIMWACLHVAAPALASERVSFRDTAWGMTLAEVQKVSGDRLKPSRTKLQGGSDPFGRGWRDASFFRFEDELVGSRVAVVYRFDGGELTAVKVRFLHSGRKKASDDFGPQYKDVLRILTDKYGAAAVTVEYGATSHNWGSKGLVLTHQPWETWMHGAGASLDVYYIPPRAGTRDNVTEKDKEKL